LVEFELEVGKVAVEIEGDAEDTGVGLGSVE